MFKFHKPSVAKLFHSICIQFIEDEDNQSLEDFIKKVRKTQLNKCLAETDEDNSDFSITKTDLVDAYNNI